jgi:hypothetical protein
MTRADHFKNAYAALKENIIYEIRDIVRHQDDRVLELYESRRTPALVTQVIDDQESETIHELYIDDKDRLLATAGVYVDDVEYNLNDLEVPLLIEILNSATIHTEESPV